MLTYLFDASAAVQVYAPSNLKAARAVHYILAQKMDYKHAALFIPNICIVEVFNALAKKRYKAREGALTPEQYLEYLARFRRHIHWGKYFYPYDVNRYHILASDMIIAVEQRVPSLNERDHLSSFDILVIAMSCELGFVGAPETTYLVTCDRRMKRVFEELKRTSTDRILEWTGSVGLDYPIKRWQPPCCLLLQDLARGELKGAPSQAEFIP